MEREESCCEYKRGCCDCHDCCDCCEYKREHKRPEPTFCPLPHYVPYYPYPPPYSTGDPMYRWGTVTTNANAS